MSARRSRVLRASVTGLIGALIVALSIWVQIVFAPNAAMAALDPSPMSVLTDCLRRSAILIVPLAVLAAFSGPWPFKLMSYLMFALGWYWVADRVGAGFPAPEGGSWLAGEAFGALIYEPFVTPMLALLSILAFRQALRALNKG
ncbi:hypothetical protein [Thioclava indica]|uniref:Uncharacterized protein n=1 Tax=Thioclava indica TaxID=1353528 RepID=A0A074K1H9_9RHOB|nr:hypothetical protein [Thioclava indica]KEO61593.1 hypothetical protein DT23_01080 [Thioclava indica]